MPRYSIAFFLAAISFLIAGIAMGLFMVITNDHSLGPVHAHTNLLGWVSSAIMGLFYAHAGDRLPKPLIWTHFVVYTVGVAAMMYGIAMVVSGGKKAAMPFVHIGVLGVIAGVLMFLGALVLTARNAARSSIQPEKSA